MVNYVITCNYNFRLFISINKLIAETCDFSATVVAIWIKHIIAYHVFRCFDTYPARCFEMFCCTSLVLVMDVDRAPDTPRSSDISRPWYVVNPDTSAIGSIWQAGSADGPCRHNILSGSVPHWMNLCIFYIYIYIYIYILIKLHM